MCGSIMEDALRVDHVDWGNDMLVNLFSLWKDKILCDTKILCENDETLQAHSILLAAVSPPLYSFFRNLEQGTYTLRCTSVPSSIWKNCLNFIYRGRLDISKEELVPTYNLATKLAMFNFSKQLATKLEDQGLVKGGSIKVPEDSSAVDVSKQDEGDNTNENDASELDSGRKSTLSESQTQVAGAGDSLKWTSETFNEAAQYTASVTGTKDNAEVEALEATHLEIDDIILSSTEDVTTAIGADNRYECPHCYLSFNRLSTLKKHLKTCDVNKTPPITSLDGGSSGKVKSSYTPLRHMYDKTEDGQYQCNVCQNVVRSYQGMYLHIKGKHMGIKVEKKKHKIQPSTEEDSDSKVKDILSDLLPETRSYCIVNNHRYYKLKCRSCGKLFKTNNLFERHVRMHHSFQAKSVHFPGSPRKHEMTVTQPIVSFTNYSSSLGAARNSVSTGVATVMTTTTGLPSLSPPAGTVTRFPMTSPGAEANLEKTFLCHICDQTFLEKPRLISHMREHNPDYLDSLRNVRKEYM